MDKQNNLSQLDPKLRDAYQRVMGTVVQPTPAAQSPQSIPQTPSPVQTTPIPAPTAQAATPVSAPPQPTISTVQSTVVKPPQLQRSFSILPIIFVVVGALFFAAYSFFWIRFFNVSIPFLPF